MARAGSGKEVKKCLPVAAIVFARRISSVPGIARITRGEIPRRRTLVGRAATIHIWVGRRVVSAVGVVITTGRNRVLLDRSTTRRRSVPGPVIVVVAAWTSLAVSVAVTVPARAETTRRRASSVPIIARRVGSATWGTGAASAVSGNIGLGLIHDEPLKKKTQEKKKSSVGQPTFGVQVTRCSLNSRPSRASTAFFRSAAVSNSTNLSCRLANGVLNKTKRRGKRTLRHWSCGQFPSRQRRSQTDGQNLSSPMSREST